MELPPPSTIPSLPQETQLRVLDTLFEPSPELHQLMIPVLANQTFSSYTNLIDAAQLNEGAEEQAEKLRTLNAEYEEKFPGLRFVTFVNGRSRDVIMVEMRQRIDRGDVEKEIDETIQGMCDIAKDRARKLQSRI
ncbi:uncharacterized protein N7500_000531 [Penicillium coprophilum]|uniref:uncharacterized protein n=1 Tax=Penicillium coprophilum TaxID=36646 RepID=UPI002381E023|nr:uncharacterized protein N7500_000531 [Penicillium coprophilum]KAJ5177832.1 hypothetical protein N7500_000531 [Penicillium coprophilum]